MEDFQALKCPIGTSSFCEEHTKAKVDSLQPTLEALANMKDTHCAFRLVSACCGTGLVQWIMRTVPPSSTSSALTLFDTRVRRLVEGIGGFVTEDLEWH